jgi:hypothetical protein
MTRAQRTKRAFHTWLQIVKSPRSLKKAEPRPPRNEHERLQRELRARAKAAEIYRPNHGQKFTTKRRPYQKMIVDPYTGQWWNRQKYAEREERRTEARKWHAQLRLAKKAA